MSKKISALTALTAPADGDLLPIVDVSDTTDAVSGTTKKIAVSSFFPTSSTDNAIARFDSTTGKLLQNSGIVIDDISGNRILIKGEAVDGTPTRVNLRGGAQLNADGVGGSCGVQGAPGTGNSAGGEVRNSGGDGAGSGAGGANTNIGGTGGAIGAGGAAIVQGGAGGATSGAGGSAEIYGGNATNGGSDGGRIALLPGAGNGAGTPGAIVLGYSRNSTEVAVLDLSLIASSNKTFTFPNATGALALQTGVTNYAADTASNDTYVITLAPVPAAYVAGMAIYFKATTANTTDATLNVNGLGAVAIKKGVSTALSSNDILAGMMCHVVFDGTNFILMNPRAL